MLGNVRDDDAGTGKIVVADRLDSGSISRADVAETLRACLDLDHTIGKAFELLEGETPIAEALAGL